jgi:hypothetical protein
MTMMMMEMAITILALNTINIADIEERITNKN